MSLDVETKIQILNTFGFGVDSISKILNCSRKLVLQAVKKKYEFEKRKERFHQTLNCNLQADLFLDDTKITVKSLFDSNKHSRVILEQYSILTLADKKQVLAYAIIPSIQITKDNLLHFFKKNLDIIKNKRIQVDRLFKEIETVAQELNFTVIRKVKSRDSPYLTHIERQHGLWKKRVYRISKFIRKLSKLDEEKTLQLIEAIIETQFFKRAEKLFQFYLENKELLEQKKLRKLLAICH